MKQGSSSTSQQQRTPAAPLLPAVSSCCTMPAAYQNSTWIKQFASVCAVFWWWILTEIILHFLVLLWARFQERGRESWLFMLQRAAGAVGNGLVVSPPLNWRAAAAKAFTNRFDLRWLQQQHTGTRSSCLDYCCSSAAKNGLAISSAPVVGDTMVTAVPRQTCAAPSRCAKKNFGSTSAAMNATGGPATSSTPLDRSAHHDA